VVYLSRINYLLLSSLTQTSYSRYTSSATGRDIYNQPVRKGLYIATTQRPTTLENTQGSGRQNTGTIGRKDTLYRQERSAEPTRQNNNTERPYRSTSFKRQRRGHRRIQQKYCTYSLIPT